jgi:hypothetical protein
MRSTLNRPARCAACASGTSRSRTCISGRTTASASPAHETVTVVPAAPAQPRPGADTPPDGDTTRRPRRRDFEEATAVRIRGQRAGRAMTILRRTLHSLRHVNGGLRRASDFAHAERAVVPPYLQTTWKPRQGASPAVATEPATWPPAAQWPTSSAGPRPTGSPPGPHRLRAEAHKEAIHSQGNERRQEIYELRDDTGSVPRRIRVSTDVEALPSVRAEVVAINQNRMPEGSDYELDWLAFKEWAEDKPLIRIAERAPREKPQGFLSHWFY